MVLEMGLGNFSGFGDEIPDLNFGRILYVSINGDDTTAQAGDPEKPFATNKEAMNQTQTGDLIITYPGLYDEYNIAPKAGVTWFLYPNAVIKPTYNGGKVAIVTDLINGVGVPDFKIRGYGEFITLGIPEYDATSFVASFATTNYDIEARRVSSFESWNEQGAFLKIKNALIDFVIMVYLGGTAVLENCLIHNAESYFYYRPDYSKFICYDCWFIKDAPNADLAANYPSRFQTTECLVYDGRWNDISNDSVFEFHNTKFVNARGANNVLVGNQNTANSYLGFYGCKFYNTDLTKNSILYDDSGRADSNLLKFFFDDCISNVDVRTIDSNNNGSKIVNEFATPIMTVSPNFKLYY